jgi:cytochrome c-type biogenesis protein CcmH
MLVVALAAVLLSAQAALGQPAADPAQEKEAKEIETMVIAPCCWSQQVSVHQSPAADQMKKDIRAQLAEGNTRPQILDAFVAQYGERILAEPPARGFKRTLYVLPVLLLVASGVVLSFVVKRMARQPALAGGPAEPGGRRQRRLPRQAQRRAARSRPTPADPNRARVP